MELVHGNRSVNVALEDNSSRLFMREDVRLDSTKRYQEAKEEELKSQLVGSGLEAKSDSELEETIKTASKARQVAPGGPGECRQVAWKAPVWTGQKLGIILGLTFVTDKFKTKKSCKI